MLPYGSSFVVGGSIYFIPFPFFCFATSFPHSRLRSPQTAQSSSTCPSQDRRFGCLDAFLLPLLPILNVYLFFGLVLRSAKFRYSEERNGEPRHLTAYALTCRGTEKFAAVSPLDAESAAQARLTVLGLQLHAFRTTGRYRLALTTPVLPERVEGLGGFFPSYLDHRPLYKFPCRLVTASATHERLHCYPT